MTTLRPGDAKLWTRGCTCMPNQPGPRFSMAYSCPMHGPGSPRRQVIEADAHVILPAMESESVDLIVTDPPYRTISGGNASPSRPTGMLSSNDGRIFKHNDIKFDEYVPDLYRVLKPQAHLYLMTNELNRRAAEDALLSSGFRIHQLLTWRKNNATPNRWYMKNYEFTFFAYKGPARTINNPGSKACHDFDNVVGKMHETEKPVDLMLHYVQNSARPGDLILDPFCGVSSTGVAAMCHGCQYIGIEKDGQYIAEAQARTQQR